MDRPEVVIVDPRDDGRAGDVLESDGSPGSRRLLGAGLLVVALLAAVSATGEVRQRRAAAADERRLQGALSLELSPRFVAELQPELVGDDAVLRFTHGVRNTGPRGITVLGAALGSLTSDEEVQVDARDDVRLQLSRRVSCAQEPPLDEPASEVLLRVRTEDGREHRVGVPSGLVEDAYVRAGARACGFLDLQEAPFYGVATSERVGDAVRVVLEVSNGGRNPLSLVSLAVGTGLSAQVTDEDGRPLVLPLALEPFDGAVVASRYLRMVLRVEDCEQVARPALGTSEPGAPDTVAVVFEDAAGASSEGATQVLDPSLLPALLDETC